jgi:hypothetical protein
MHAALCSVVLFPVAVLEDWSFCDLCTCATHIPLALFSFCYLGSICCQAIIFGLCGELFVDREHRFGLPAQSSSLECVTVVSELLKYQNSPVEIVSSLTWGLSIDPHRIWATNKQNWQFWLPLPFIGTRLRHGSNRPVEHSLSQCECCRMVSLSPFFKDQLPHTIRTANQRRCFRLRQLCDRVWSQRTNTLRCSMIVRIEAAVRWFQGEYMNVSLSHMTISSRGSLLFCIETSDDRFFKFHCAVHPLLRWNWLTTRTLCCGHIVCDAQRDFLLHSHVSTGHSVQIQRTWRVLIFFLH